MKVSEWIKNLTEIQNRSELDKFSDEEINRKCRSWSGIEIGTIGYWFVAIIFYLLALLLHLHLTL